MNLPVVEVTVTEDPTDKLIAAGQLAEVRVQWPPLTPPEAPLQVGDLVWVDDLEAAAALKHDLNVPAFLRQAHRVVSCWQVPIAKVWRVVVAEADWQDFDANLVRKVKA